MARRPLTFLDPEPFCRLDHFFFWTQGTSRAVGVWSTEPLLREGGWGAPARDLLLPSTSATVCPCRSLMACGPHLMWHVGVPLPPTAPKGSTGGSLHKSGHARSTAGEPAHSLDLYGSAPPPLPPPPKTSNFLPHNPPAYRCGKCGNTFEHLCTETFPATAASGCHPRHSCDSFLRGFINFVFEKAYTVMHTHGNRKRQDAGCRKPSS